MMNQTKKRLTSKFKTKQTKNEAKQLMFTLR